MPDGVIRLPTIAEPPTPPSGRVYVWLDTGTGTLKQKNDAGTVEDFEGPQGATGATGATGPAGPAGPSSILAHFRREGEFVNTSTTMARYVAANYNFAAAGWYAIGVDFRWAYDATNSDFESQVVVGSLFTQLLNVQEPQDSGGGGGGTGTNQRHNLSHMFSFEVTTPGNQLIDVQLATSAASVEASMLNCYVYIYTLPAPLTALT